MKCNSKTGFTLIELLVSIVIFSGAIVINSKLQTQLKRAMASARLSGEISHLRESLRSLVNCERTLNPHTKEDGSVVCNGSITLRDYSGVPVSEVLGQWRIQNSCSSTGLLINAEHTKKAEDPLTGKRLDFASAKLNPIMGQGTPYGLCENSFTKIRRVKLFKVANSEISFDASHCSVMSSPVSIPRPPNPPPAPSNPANLINFKAAQAAFNAPFYLANQLHAKCSDYCKLDPRFFTGGYLVDCSSSEVTCVCFR